MNVKGFVGRRVLLAAAKAGTFAGDRRGSVMTIVAVCLPFMLGFAGLACEFGYSLVRKSENQRVADMAAYAGALAYSQGQSEDQAKQAAWRVAAMNGVQKAELVGRIVPSPRDPSVPAMEVSVAVDHPLYLSRIIYDKASLRVTNVAYAETASAAEAQAGCMLALDAGSTGLTLSGGTSVSAPKCTVSSNAAVSVPCGTTLTAKEVTYGSSSAPSQPCSGIKGPGGTAAKITKQVTDDPLAGSAAIAAAMSRFKSVDAIHVDDLGGPDIDFGWTQSTTQAAAKAAGCSAAFSGSKWTLACDGKQEARFGKMTVGGGLSVDFCVSCSGKTFSFGSVTATGTVRFGPGQYSIAKGIVVPGGSSATFMAGKGNGYRIGAGANGAAVSVQGGASLVFSQDSGPASVFETAGDIVSSGGSCVVLPAAAQHDVDGSISLQGQAGLGAGTYTVNGYFSMSAGGGNCSGQSGALSAKDVSIVLSGKTLSKSGGCNGAAFCMTGGQSGTVLTAPASGPLAKLAIVGPQSSSGGMALTGGASNFTVSGVLYFPKGPILESGGASSASAAGGCLQMIGKSITLTGGTTAASSCDLAAAAGGAAGKGKVRIVQ